MVKKNEFWSKLLKESNGKYSSEFKDLCWKMIDRDPKKDLKLMIYLKINGLEKLEI